MEPTKEQLEAMEAMEAQYKQDMEEIKELEAKMFADDEIKIPADPNAEDNEQEFIDPNGQEEFIDAPEPDPEPESIRAEPGTFLHWLACQGNRDDFIGDLSRIYIGDIKYNNVSYTNYNELCDHLEKYDDLIEILMFAKIEFDDFQEEEATYRDEQYMLEALRTKHVGC